MSKYYKHKHDNITVEWIREIDKDTFKAKVLINDNTCAIGEIFTCGYVDFEPCELNTATLTNDNPNKVEVDDKDVNLRLKCLELAIMGYNTNAIDKANDFYEWITQKPTNQ